MKTSRIIPVCLALTLAVAPSVGAQHNRSAGAGGQHVGDHGPAGFFEELLEWGYSAGALDEIHALVEVIHQSIEEIMGLHSHEEQIGNTEDAHRTGESALMTFHDAYESVVAELEEEHARAFTAMLFDHLFHSMASHGHDGGEGHPDIGGQDGHG